MIQGVYHFLVKSLVEPGGLTLCLESRFVSGVFLPYLFLTLPFMNMPRFWGVAVSPGFIEVGWMTEQN